MCRSTCNSTDKKKRIKLIKTTTELVVIPPKPSSPPRDYPPTPGAPGPRDWNFEAAIRASFKPRPLNRRFYLEPKTGPYINYTKQKTAECSEWLQLAGNGDGVALGKFVTTVWKSMKRPEQKAYKKIIPDDYCYDNANFKFVAATIHFIMNDEEKIYKYSVTALDEFLELHYGSWTDDAGQSYPRTTLSAFSL